jgi:hypothetical protein
VLAPVIGICLVLFTSSALADDKSESQQHFEAGKELMRAEDYVGAAVEFERSVALYPTKNGLFNLANSYKALRRYADAIEVIERLQRDFADDMGSDLNLRAAELENVLRRLVAILRIEVNKDGSSVVVDGEEVGKSPLGEPVLVGSGVHRLELSLDGHETASRTVVVVAGEEKTETFELVRTTADLVIEANVPAIEVTVDGAVVGETPIAEPIVVDPGEHVVRLSKDGYVTQEREVVVDKGELSTLEFVLEPAETDSASTVPPVTDDGEQKRVPTLVWIGLGGTVAAGAVAVTFWALAADRHRDFEKYNEQYVNFEIEADDPKFKDARADTKQFSSLALGFGIGAVALAAGTVAYWLYVLADDEPDVAEVTVAGSSIVVSF